MVSRFRIYVALPRQLFRLGLRRNKWFREVAPGPVIVEINRTGRRFSGLRWYAFVKIVLDIRRRIVPILLQAIEKSKMRANPEARRLRRTSSSRFGPSL